LALTLRSYTQGRGLQRARAAWLPPLFSSVCPIVGLSRSRLSCSCSCCGVVSLRVASLVWWHVVSLVCVPAAAAARFSCVVLCGRAVRCMGVAALLHCACKLSLLLSSLLCLLRRSLCLRSFASLVFVSCVCRSGRLSWLCAAALTLCALLLFLRITSDTLSLIGLQTAAEKQRKQRS